MTDIYPIIYDVDDAQRIVLRYCMSYFKKSLAEHMGEVCLRPGVNTHIIDFDHNRIVSVNKERALKTMARYVESLQEEQQ